MTMMPDDPVRLLIVEDDPLLGELLKLSLEAQLTSVQVVTTFKEAVEALLAHPKINAILLDLVLPDSSKEQTLRRIRELKALGPSNPVLLVMTCYWEAEADSLRNGADGFVEKFMSRAIYGRIREEVAARGVRLECSKREDFQRFCRTVVGRIAGHVEN